MTEPGTEMNGMEEGDRLPPACLGARLMLGEVDEDSSRHLRDCNPCRAWVAEATRVQQVLRCLPPAGASDRTLRILAQGAPGVLKLGRRFRFPGDEADIPAHRHGVQSVNRRAWGRSQAARKLAAATGILAALLLMAVGMWLGRHQAMAEKQVTKSQSLDVPVRLAAYLELSRACSDEVERWVRANGDSAPGIEIVQELDSRGGGLPLELPPVVSPGAVGDQPPAAAASDLPSGIGGSLGRASGSPSPAPIPVQVSGLPVPSPGGMARAAAMSPLRMAPPGMAMAAKGPDPLGVQGATGKAKPALVKVAEPLGDSSELIRLAGTLRVLAPRLLEAANALPEPARKVALAGLANDWQRQESLYLRLASEHVSRKSALEDLAMVARAAREDAWRAHERT